MSYRDHWKRMQRLTILRALNDSVGFQANSSILFELLNHAGTPITRAEVVEELQWLADGALVRIEAVGSVLIATLTERGQDVADGREFVDGVARKVA